VLKGGPLVFVGRRQIVSARGCITGSRSHLPQGEVGGGSCRVAGLPRGGPTLLTAESKIFLELHAQGLRVGVRPSPPHLSRECEVPLSTVHQKHVEGKSSVSTVGARPGDPASTPGKKWGNYPGRGRLSIF
jgi:hypothetical protein